MTSTTKILSSINQMKRLYESQFEDIRLQFRISQNEADILAFLANNPEYDTASEIAEIRMIAKSYISKSVENLMLGGLLERMPDKNDRRIIHLRLTEKSKPIIAAARRIQKEFLEIIFNDMNTDEIKTFGYLLARIFGNVNHESSK